MRFIKNMELTLASLRVLLRKRREEDVRFVGSKF
jgi:hypothetical protein